MTREEAIKILADLTDNIFLHTWEKQNKALHMAIEALSAESQTRWRNKESLRWLLLPYMWQTDQDKRICV